MITGERKRYMDAGFPSRESAKREIGILIRDSKKYKKQGYNLNEMFQSGVRIPTPMIGKYWRIKKIKSKSSENGKRSNW
jgi:hypothetical protein